MLGSECHHHIRPVCNNTPVQVWQGVHVLHLCHVHCAMSVIYVCSQLPVKLACPQTVKKCYAASVLL